MQAGSWEARPTLWHPCALLLTAHLRLACFGLDCRWVSAPLCFLCPDTSWTHSVDSGSAFCVRACMLVHCTSVRWSVNPSACPHCLLKSVLFRQGASKIWLGTPAAQIGYRLQLVAPDYQWKQLHTTGGNVLQSSATVATAVRTQDRRGLVSFCPCLLLWAIMWTVYRSPGLLHPLTLRLFELASRRSEMGVHGVQRGSRGSWEAWEAYFCGNVKSWLCRKACCSAVV